jgi:hypothetical protein
VNPWFDDVPVLGAMPAEAARAKLLELGEVDVAAAAAVGPAAPQAFAVWDRNRPCQYTAHVFGHVGEIQVGGPTLIRSVTELAPDESLKSVPLRIALGKLGVVDYPGGGTHVVLFDLAARHYANATDVEELHYNVVVRATEGQRAGLLNVPIFVGLNPGTEGVALHGYTVNVRNDQDEELLALLESGAVRSGLRLLQAAQPALAPLSQIAYSLTKAMAVHNRNVPVQSFILGLDFTPSAFGAVLRTGAYIAVQVPAELQYAWEWAEWVYDPRVGDIVSRTEPTTGLPYNHVVFTVNRETG